MSKLKELHDSMSSYSLDDSLQVSSTAPSPLQSDWVVRKGRNKSAEETFNTKKEAVEYARELAKEEDVDKVIVHKLDGTIDRSRSRL